MRLLRAHPTRAWGVAHLVGACVLLLAFAGVAEGSGSGTGCVLSHAIRQICGTTSDYPAGARGVVVAYYTDLSGCNFPTDPSDPEAGDNGRYVVGSVTIDWGDGTTSAGTAEKIGSCTGSSHNDDVGAKARVTGSHAYKKAGKHTVRVSLTYLRGAGNTYMNCASPCVALGAPVTSTVTSHGADTILSGRVTRYVCRDTEYLKMGGDNASFCLLTSVKPVGNVEVLAAGKHFRSARTRSDGSYEVAVPRGGAYTVSIFGSVGGHLPSRRFGASATVRPSSYHVSGTADVRDLNFQLCKPPSEPFAGGGVAEYSGPKLPCGVKLYEFSGTLLDIYGQPVDGQYVAIDPNAERVHAAPGDEFQTGGLDDAIQTDSRGHFQLFVERGTHEVWAGTVERLRTVSISRDTTGVQLEIKPIIVDASGYPNQVVVNTYGLPTSPPNGFFVTIAHSPVADTICQYRVPAANTHYTRIVPASFVPFGFVPSFHKFCSGDWTASLFSAREPQQIIASQPFTVK